MNQIDTALVTVEEAKSKWCPETRVGLHAGNGGVSVNRCIILDVAEDTLCQGDACMFWRWHDQGPRPQRYVAVVKATWDEGWDGPAGPVEDPGPDIFRPAGWTGKPDDGRDWQFEEDEGYWFIPAPDLAPRGYCGKAGHPYAAILMEMQIEELSRKRVDAERKDMGL